MNPENKYIKEFEKTLEIPPSLTMINSFFEKDARDFWRFISVLYDMLPPNGKRKLTWKVKRYEKRTQK